MAGSAGLLQTTEDIRFELCPELTAAGRGVVSPENIAFTHWLPPAGAADSATGKMVV